MPSTCFIVARKELLELVRDRRLRWAAVVVWLLAAVSLVTAWPEYRRQAAERDAQHTSARQHWLDQGTKNPHTAAHFGTYAIRPQTPLTLFDPGVTTYVGTQVLLEAHWQNPLQGRAADAAPASYRLGTLSPAAVLQQILPLAIILLGYTAFAGERDRGTWTLLLSQGAGATQIGLGKLLALCGALGVLLVPPVFAGVLAATMAAAERGDVLLRGFLLAILYIAYALTCLAVTLYVSLRSRSSRHAVTMLLTLWIVSTLIVPRAAADLSRILFPSPSAFTFHEGIYAAKAQGLNGHDPEDARVAALRARTLEAYGVTRIEDLPVNFEGLALQADEEYGHRLFERGYGSLQAIFDRQTLLQRLSSVTSPVQAIRLASMAFAGTDAAHDRDFARQAENYRRDLVKAMNDDLTHRSRIGDAAYAGDRSTWARVAAFAYMTPPALWALRAEWLSCGIAALWCGGSLAALWLALRSRGATGRP